MHPKRPRAYDDDDYDTVASAPQPRPQKRQRTVQSALSQRDHPAPAPAQQRADLLSQLPSEILIRILSYLSLPHLLSVAPVSARFRRLAHDNQLWKALYYARFVLPRAMRIPGFREGKLAERLRDHKLHYKGKRTLWASGRSGGLVRDAAGPPDGWKIRLTEEEEGLGRKSDSVNWKRQFKIRHNWARGKCAVEELRLGPGPEDQGDVASDDLTDGADRSRMLVKVVEGLAVTVDRTSGLRAWDLKTREVLAQASLGDDDEGETEPAHPSCIAIDDRSLDQGTLHVSVGFVDGSFGVWALSTQAKTISRRYRHEKSSNGELIGMAYAHPYLLTATRAVLISLYTFDVPPKTADGEDEHEARDPPTQGLSSKLKSALSEYADDDTATDQAQLPAPYLMTSLKSYSSSPPLALSIRKTASATVASIAYTFFTRHGWSIGIQDLQITPDEALKSAPVITTRLAYTTPTSISTHGQALGARVGHPQPGTPSRETTDPTSSPNQQHPAPPSPPTSSPQRPPQSNHHQQHQQQIQGPTTLCYSHPYLLATLPDNTLILHLCTSTAAALSISPGIRLWGHTSGISDAEITARGKAVSVSSRGDEMRVWELEGRPSGVRSRSVEVRAAAAAAVEAGPPPPHGGGVMGEEEKAAGGSEDGRGDWEERRNWVGFDDEMVIVLKEARGGRESLLVYDFT